MERSPKHNAKFHAALAWVPVLVYFVTKYLIFANEMPRDQWLLLIAAVVLAEVALWRYRRQALRKESTDGAD